LPVGRQSRQVYGISYIVYRAGERQEQKELNTIFEMPKVDLLVVCLGQGKQEKFIDKYKTQLSAKVLIGAGGSVDYISGTITRAPKLIQKAGFEWLYRLMRQPSRWRRQLALVEFVRMTIKKRVYGKQGKI
jgi:N-acetylglucosaminyldiphosphoundecaprenol N-acetyl-beta-D-mannosaminyltransferase